MGPVSTFSSPSSLPCPHAVTIGRDETVLRAIGEARCALAVWRRGVPPPIAEALATRSCDEIDDIDAPVRVEDATLETAALLAAAGYPGEVASPLALDIARLARCHADLRAWSSVRLRLDWIETDACRRFHADMLGTRLLTTYIGRGTQWRPANDPDGAVRELVAGDVAILKGRLLAPGAPILHRSPPIAATGGRRLLLVIDGPRPAGLPPE